MSLKRQTRREPDSLRELLIKRVIYRYAQVDNIFLMWRRNKLVVSAKFIYQDPKLSLEEYARSVAENIEMEHV